jgi:hypothetical protein
MSRAENFDTAAAMLVAYADLLEQSGETCVWSPDDDGVYQTTCGHSFEFTTDGPVENKMAFCGYCGRRLTAEAVL